MGLAAIRSVRRALQSLPAAKSRVACGGRATVGNCWELNPVLILDGSRQLRAMRRAAARHVSRVTECPGHRDLTARSRVGIVYLSHLLDFSSSPELFPP